jgi:hypothetical protein
MRIMVDKVTLEQVLFGVLLIIAPNSSSPFPELCNSPDQTAHYHIFGLSIRGFISDPALDWLQSKEAGLYYKIVIIVI